MIEQEVSKKSVILPMFFEPFYDVKTKEIKWTSINNYAIFIAFLLNHYAFSAPQGILQNTSTSNPL